MSWSCSTSGPKEEVQENVNKSLDASATYYDSQDSPVTKQEAQDCRDAKRQIGDALASMTLDADSYAPHGYLASVSAYGSRSVGSVSVSVSVTKTPKPEPKPE